MVVSALACTVAMVSPARPDFDRVRISVATVGVLDRESLEDLPSVSHESIVEFLKEGQVVASTPYVRTPIRGGVPFSGIGREYANVLKLEDIENMEVLRDAVDGFRSMGVFFQGGSMNSLSSYGGMMSSGSMPDLEMELGPGTIFVPDNPDYQNMTLFGTIRTTFRFQPELHASLRPEFLMQSVTGRTLCLNMDKKEPDGTVKYWPVGSADPVVAKLAYLTANQRSVGTQDQARMWLYTDKASLAEINKRLSPKVVPGYYVRALREVDLVGGMTDKDRKNKALYATELLFAPNGSSYASKYFFAHMANHFPKETRQALEKGHGNEVNLLWDANAADLKQAHVNFMLEHLLTAESDDAKLGMLRFLNDRVPTSAKPWVKGLEHFSNVSTLATSENKAIAELAAQVLRSFGST